VVLISDINQWWETLTSAHQVFWFIAIIFTVLFLIQFILLLIGFEAGSGSLDHPGDAGVYEHEFSALSVRSIIAFFTFFGWTGVLALNNHLSVWMAVLFASIAGLTAMFIVAYMVFKLSQLEQSGTLNLYNALDQLGEVYLSIPGQGKGTGKVHLKVDGTVREVDAVTKGDTLKTGASIKVIEIMDGNVLMVEQIPPSAKTNFPG
jgi:membrane protein implicated in regulation of membrane protease activity